MIDTADIKERVEGHSLVRNVDQLPKGHVRLQTAFLYPDGSAVDVFVVEEAASIYKLSDLGQTTNWLLDVQVKPWLSKKRQRFVEDALHNYEVTQAGGALERALASIDLLIDGVVNLGQACVRVADLIYTRRSALQSSFSEDVEEFLSDSELEFESNQELVGRHGTKVRVDFLVRGTRSTSALLSLASGTSAQAHIAANEIFRRWYDLDIPSRTEHRVTVFDDRFDVYRDDDLHRLRDLSDVVPLSDRQALSDLLFA